MKRFSFGRLLRNDRLMMVCSLLLAAVMWYFVISGSSNITTRTITCTLNTANVSNGTLQVIEEKTVTVDVVVEGAWSDILGLTAEDIRVQLNAADIRAVGNCRINVVASRNSQKSGYEILSTSPSVTTLFCDEWVEEKVFTVAAGEVVTAAPNVTAVGEKQECNDPIIEGATLPGGVLLVQGPRTEVDRIAKIAVTVDAAMELSEKHIFEGDIVAMNNDGEVLDLKYCRFLRYAEDPAAVPGTPKIVVSSLDVLVTLQERQEIAFTYEVQNAPSGVDASTIVTLDPPAIVIEGEQELVQQYTEALTKLEPLNFDTLFAGDRQLVQTIVLPEGITVIGSEDYVSKNENGETVLTVTKKLNWSGYAHKVIRWDLGSDLSDTPIKFENVPEGFNVKMETTRLSVMVVGKASVINALNGSHLSATVALEAGNLGTYVVRPTVDNPNAWVYYGASNEYVIHVSTAARASVEAPPA